jgi:hypothetical protein
MAWLPPPAGLLGIESDVAQQAVIKSRELPPHLTHTAPTDEKNASALDHAPSEDWFSCV